MTIADQIRRAKTDYDEVFAAGYAHGVSGSTVTFQKDESTAYIKTVPSNAEPKAMLLSVGGMTKKCSNLFDINTAEAASPYGGISSEVIGNTLKVTCSVASRTGHIKLGTFEAGDYSIRVIFTNLTQCNIYEGADLNSLANLRVGVSSNNSIKFTLSETKTLWLTAVYGNSVEFYTFSDIMLNEGTTALPYEPYFEGLRDSKVTEIVNRGKNLFDEKQITHTANRSGTQTGYGFVADGVLTARLGAWGDVCEWHPFGVELEAGSYTLSADCFIPTGGAPNLSIALGLGTQQITTISAYDRWERIKVTVNITSAKKYYVQLQGVGDGSMYIGMDVRFKNIQIQRGTTATEYTPYSEPITKPIPEEITALEGYGGGTEEYANTLDIVNKELAMYGKKYVFTGDEKWTVSGVTNKGMYRYSISLSGMKKSSGANGLCDKYPTFRGNWNENTTESVRFGQVNTGLYLYLYDDITATEVAERVKGMTVFYELEEPKVVDLSTALADFDNILDVERGGSIEFVNEYRHAVPSSILYTVKVGT